MNLANNKPYFYPALAGWLLVGILFIGYYVLAWNPPTANPPAANLPAPLNVSSTSQIKVGPLTITPAVDNTSVFRVNNASNYPVLNIDSANKRIGVGTTAPQSLLHLVGTGGESQGIKLQNDTFSSLIYNDPASQSLTLSGPNSVQVKPTNPNNTGLIIKGLASQSANLLEVKNSADNNVATIDAFGNLNISSLNTTGNITALGGDVKGTRLCIAEDCQSSWPAGGGGGSIPLQGVIFSTSSNNPNLLNAGYAFTGWKINYGICSKGVLTINPDGSITCVGGTMSYTGWLYAYIKNM